MHGTFVTLIIKHESSFSTFPQHSQTRLTLEGADKDVFSAELQVTATVGVVQLLVRQSQNLDFEKKQEMVLEVRKV